MSDKDCSNVRLPTGLNSGTFDTLCLPDRARTLRPLLGIPLYTTARRIPVRSFESGTSSSHVSNRHVRFGGVVASGHLSRPHSRQTQGGPARAVESAVEMAVATSPSVAPNTGAGLLSGEMATPLLARQGDAGMRLAVVL